MTDELKPWRATWTIDRFIDHDGRVAEELQAGRPNEDMIAEHPERHIDRSVVAENMNLDEGLHEMLLLLTGQGGIPFDGQNAHMAVGDGDAEATPLDRGLMGQERAYKRVDSSYPVVKGTTVEFKATFGPGDANFPWNEYAIANGPSEKAVHLNRRVRNKGIKEASEGETWSMRLEIKWTDRGAPDGN